MSVESTRPSIEELTFHVYARPLHPELFEILAMETIERPEYKLSLQIIPTGHVVMWDTTNVCLTEVATSTSQPLPEKRRLFQSKLRQELSRKIECAHGVCYQMSFQVERMKPEIFLHAHDELLADGQKHGRLLHNFQPNHRLSVAPLTLIAAETKAQCVMISTFHTFPAENSVVKSQTLIEIKSEE
ncbi:MAG: DUF2617 family protein [Gemmataceae bacterium]